MSIGFSFGFGSHGLVTNRRTQEQASTIQSAELNPEILTEAILTNALEDRLHRQQFCATERGYIGLAGGMRGRIFVVDAAPVPMVLRDACEVHELSEDRRQHLKGQGLDAKYSDARFLYTGWNSIYSRDYGRRGY